MSSDPVFDAIDEVGEGSVAEDVFTRPTGVVNVVDVAFPESDEDVTARITKGPWTRWWSGREEHPCLEL